MKTKHSGIVLSTFLLLFNILVDTQIPGIAGGELKGQTIPTPDCVKSFSFTADGSGGQTAAVQDNRSVGCVTWTVIYQATGSGSITSVTFQSADGALTAGTYGDYAGTVDSGSTNPMTSSTGQIAYFTNDVVTTPWLRILLSEGTFVGTLNGVYYGWKKQGSVDGGGGGGGGGCSDPCTVIQPTAANLNARVQGVAADGAAVSGNPVRVAGKDPSGNTQDVATDTGGGVAPAAAAIAGADGVINTQLAPTNSAGAAAIFDRVWGHLFNGTTWDRQPGTAAGGAYVQGNTTTGNVISGFNPLIMGITSAGGRARNLFAPNAIADGDSGSQSATVYNQTFNGTTWDRSFVCTGRANISLSAGTDVTIVTNGGGTTKVRICHVSFSQDNSAVVTIRQGTGTTCGTNQVDISGGYVNVLGMALDFQPTAALITTVAARDVCLHFSTAVTAGGVVVYALY